jgi:hypothetical protein
VSNPGAVLTSAMAKGKEMVPKGTPAPVYPSIQAFYKREVTKLAEKEEVASEEAVNRGDGFTEEEMADAQDPLNRKWNPEREYEELNMAELFPGPKAVTFVVCVFQRHLVERQ